MLLAACGTSAAQPTADAAAVAVADASPDSPAPLDATADVAQAAPSDAAADSSQTPPATQGDAAADTSPVAKADAASADAGHDATPPTSSDASADAGTDAVSDGAAPQICMGQAAFCNKKLTEITIASTHDAFSYAAGGPVTYSVPNQDRPIPDQLAYGIRAFGIRPCPYFGIDPTQTNVVYVTHNSSLKGILGEEPLANILTEVKTFLDANPNEIVMLFAESTVTPAQVAGVFDGLGLDPYLYTHDPAVGFPTIGEMIRTGRRLVMFNDSQDSTRPAWQLYLWDYLVDTDYNITDKSQFKCDYYRGTAGNPFYFLNQFIYRDLGNGVMAPDKILAGTANDPAFVVSRATGCWKAQSRRPNFIYVDWYGQGDVKSAVDSLNAMTSPP